jgi:hypothetical protein
MNNKLAAVGLAAGLLGGAAAGLALGVPGLAGAQSDATTTTTPATTSPDTTAPAGTDPAETPATKDRSAWMSEALAPLVAAGTITQAQADAVIEALQAAKPERGHGHGPGIVHASLETAATALGVTTEELRTALRDGKSVADVAAEKGVDVQVVIDALVADAQERIATAVSDGRITQAQADARLATLTDDITKIVNGEGRGFGRGRGPGRGGDEDAPAPPTTEASS